MSTLERYFGVFAVSLVTSTVVAYFGNDDAADGASYVTTAVTLYILWVAFGRPFVARLRRKETVD
jgi:hypothetical protein